MKVDIEKAEDFLERLGEISEAATNEIHDNVLGINEGEGFDILIPNTHLAAIDALIPMFPDLNQVELVPFDDKFTLLDFYGTPAEEERFIDALDISDIPYEVVMDDDLDDEPDDIEVPEGSTAVEEARIIRKVNAKGKVRRKLKCRAGFVSRDGKCVAQTASEKLSRKTAIRKAVRTRKNAGGAAKRRSTLRRNKAMKKRRNMGLK